MIFALHQWNLSYEVKDVYLFPGGGEREHKLLQLEGQVELMVTNLKSKEACGKTTHPFL